MHFQLGHQINCSPGQVPYPLSASITLLLKTSLQARHFEGLFEFGLVVLPLPFRALILTIATFLGKKKNARCDLLDWKGNLSG